MELIMMLLEGLKFLIIADVVLSWVQRDVRQPGLTTDPAPCSAKVVHHVRERPNVSHGPHLDPA